MAVFIEHGYRKVCAGWVLKLPTFEHQHEKSFVQNSGAVRMRCFRSNIIIGDETWVPRYDPLTKRQSVELHNQSSPHKKKFIRQTSANRVMASVFWDSKGIFLVEILETGATLNQSDVWAH